MTAEAPGPGDGAASTARMITAIAVGNCLELYDFALFGYFSVVIAKVFFPAADPSNSLLLALSTFGVGFVTRPVGGILFGAHADRRGRREAMVVTMALMSVGTAVMALCPSYAAIGVAAPVILVVGRLIQGLGMGGEVAPAATLLYELGGDRRRVLFVSVFAASQGVSALLGSLTGFGLGVVFDPAAIAAGAWRLPFLLGLALGPIGIVVRNAVPGAGRRRPVGASPLRDLLSRHRRPLAFGFLLFLSGTASMYVVVLYMPTYLTGVLGVPPRTAYLAGGVAGSALAVMSPLGGLIADRRGVRRPLALTAVCLSTMLIIPAFRFLQAHPDVGAILAVVGTLSGLTALQAGSVLSLILESFPPDVRATGLALVYSAGVVVGGFGQLFATALVRLVGDPAAPAYYVIACSALTAAALAFGMVADRRSRSGPAPGAGSAS